MSLLLADPRIGHAVGKDYGYVAGLTVLWVSDGIDEDKRLGESMIYLQDWSFS